MSRYRTDPEVAPKSYPCRPFSGEAGRRRLRQDAVEIGGRVVDCCAFTLLRDGHRVTLIDRDEPGRGCSFGNGGIIQIGASVPVATPGVLRQVPRMLLDPNGPLVIRFGRHEIDGLVLATGAWSKRWAAKLGARIPMDSERGYHVMLSDPGVDLRVPVLSGDHRFGITPMADGIRLAGTAELASLEAPPDYRRAEMMTPLAKALLPDLRVESRDNWMGHRPSTADSLPVIGRASGFPEAFFAFGHGHLGFTLGPITGRLIADLAIGRPPAVDTRPYAAERFE